MKLETHTYYKEKNNVCQVICKEILHRNPCRSDRYNFISAIYSFLEANVCRLFSDFQALVQNIESRYFGFLCDLGFSSQGSVGSPGFSRFLKAFAGCGRGADSPTKTVGFYTPVYDRLFFFHLITPRDVEALL